MPHIGLRIRIQAPAALLMSLAVFGLAACGSSSSGSPSTGSTSTAGSASTPASATTTAASTKHSTAGTAIEPFQLHLRQLLAKCIRRSGIDLPEPNAEGQFDTKGINESSPKFKTAVGHCIQALPKGHG